MALNAARLNRSIQIQRAVQTSGPGGVVTTVWQNVGPVLSAQRTDIKDSERIVAARWQNKLVSRFVIRATSFARSIRRTDRLLHDGLAFEISGIKEAPHGQAFMEVTAETDETP